MQVDFYWQPWATGLNLDDFFHTVSQRPGPARLRVAVAWAKRSGLRRIRPYLDAFRAGGGEVTFVVGLSEGGATRQGLELALQVADSVYLFHDLSGRTFHPKVYLAESRAGADVLVGSHNLTAGGVYFNYEAGIVASVSADDLTCSRLYQSLDSWFEALLSDRACCRALDETELPALVANPLYRIGDEDHRRSAARNEADAPEDIDSVTDVGDIPTPFFGRSTTEKKGGRHTPEGADGSRAAGGGQRGDRGPASPGDRIDDGDASQRVGAEGPSSRGRADVRWSKRLKGTDAQQPPGPTTQPTHNLRLSAARHHIDIETWFRETLFGELTWQPDGVVPNLEYTLVPVEVVVSSHRHKPTPAGVETTHEFRVDHNLGRVSGQNNVPTVLKWGSIESYLRTHNHVDDWVLLERFPDGSFQMTITDTDPGTT